MAQTSPISSIMESVWASLSQPRAAGTSSARIQPPVVGSIWSQPRTAAHPAAANELFHPRYSAVTGTTKRLVQDQTVQPLLVSTAHGHAGLEHKPYYDEVLWPDRQRSRFPLGDHPDAARLAAHDTTRDRRLFDIIGNGPAAAAQPHFPRYSGPTNAADQAFHPQPTVESTRLGGLQLGPNMFTHIPHPDQISPFTALIARPPPLSVEGFRPLRVESIEQRWNSKLGVQGEPQRRDPREEEKQQEYQQHQQLRSAPRVASSHVDVATSPLPQSRSHLSQDQRETYSIALSPRAPSPQSHREVEQAHHAKEQDERISDELLTRRAEHQHAFSIKSLKAQLVELQKDDRQLEKERRQAEKKSMMEERKWDQLVGLDTVRESQEMDLSAMDLSTNAAAISQQDPALTLDDEKEISTQTDATLSLQHPLKPKLAHRSTSAAANAPPVSLVDQISAEVAAEYAIKRQELLGERRPPSKVDLAKKTLPAFQSHADKLRSDLRAQHDMLLRAQLDAMQNPQGEGVGEAVERRMKKMREDTLWIVRPYKSARDAHHVGQTPAEALSRENSQVPGADLPETIIGSRTAALMFVDPRMMARKTVPHTVGEPLPGQPKNALTDLTNRNTELLQAKLGFDIPKGTYPEHGSTHRPLRFDQDASKSTFTAISTLGPPKNLDSEYYESKQPHQPSSGPRDPLGLFAGSSKAPVSQLREEAHELDADVAKLEATIRAMHAEFAGEKQTPAVGATNATSNATESSLLPSYSDIARSTSSTAITAAAAQRRSEAERKREDQAHAYLEKMDRVLGIRNPQRRRAEDRERNVREATEKIDPTPRGSPDKPDGVGSSGKKGSKLAAALEKYLSLDIQLSTALSSSLSKLPPRQAPSSETLHSFPVAPHDLNRPDDQFIPRSLSPSYQKKAMQAQQQTGNQSTGNPAAPAVAPLRRVPTPKQPTVHQSFDLGAPSPPSADSARSGGSISEEGGRREQREVEEMLAQTEQEYVNSTFRRPSMKQPSAQASPPIHSPQHAGRRPPLTPHGMRSPTSDQELSRVVEGEQETSRSLHSLASDPSHPRSVQSSRASLVSPTAAAGGGGSSRNFENSDDWDASGVDRSMVIHIDGQAPYQYDDSIESQRSRSGMEFRPPSRGNQLLSPRSPAASRPGTARSVSSSQGSVSSALSPRPVPSQSQAPQQAVAEEMRSPRSTRAAELRKENLARQREDLERAEQKKARIEGRAKPKSAIEVERERKKKAAAAGGMMQPTRSSTDGGRPPMSPTNSYRPPQQRAQRLPANSPLNTSTDRQVADAQALMENFRQLLVDLPDAPSTLPPPMPSFSGTTPLELDRQLSVSDFTSQPYRAPASSWEEDLQELEREDSPMAGQAPKYSDEELDDLFGP